MQRNAGYNYKLSYQPRVEEEQVGRRRSNRKRRITWFNPPFSSNCTTNIPKAFMRIIAECFPPGHVLRSSFNTNTVKASYRTMPNMAQVLAKHNAKVIAKTSPSSPTRAATARTSQPAPCLAGAKHQGWCTRPPSPPPTLATAWRPTQG